MTERVYLVHERPEGFPNMSYPFIISKGNLEAGLAKAINEAKEAGRGDVTTFQISILELKA